MAWAPNYVADADLKAFLRIGDSVDDAEIALAIAAASRAVDAACNRQFGNVSPAVERYYTAHCRSVEIDDLQDTTGLEVHVDLDGDGVYEAEVTGYTLLPRNAAADGQPYVRIELGEAAPAAEGAVRVKALWGWSSVPTAVKQATLIQAARFYSRRNSPYGVAGSPETGSELRLLAKVDPDVRVILSPYVRHWVAV